MSEQSSQEPTMEEILASIRRIISEDETPAESGPTAESLAEAARAAPMPDLPPEPELEILVEPETSAVAQSGADDEEGDLELTQKVESHGDLDVLAPAESGRTPAPALSPIGPLVSEPVAAAAAASFGQLSANILMPHTDRTLEDVVRELLRPMLQQWLDAHLPGIVQEAVQAEVERIARGRVR